jgi:hypothetical protein
MFVGAARSTIMISGRAGFRNRVSTPAFRCAAGKSNFEIINAETTPCTVAGACKNKDLRAKLIFGYREFNLDPSGKTLAECHHRNNRQRPHRTGPGHADAVARKPFIDISKFARARSERTLVRAHLRHQRTQPMTTAPSLHTTSKLAANDRSNLTTPPRVRLYKRRIAISHPDPQAGERLLAEALGAGDRDALHGILGQLVKASAVAQKPDEANLAFMISMIRSIAPRDSIEAMLVSQMVSVHMAAMRCACRLACTDDLAQQESVTRALTRLSRTFAAQVEALSRHRSSDERAITVKNLSVQDGGHAIVGNVMQHANVLVAEAEPRDTRQGAGR